MKRVDLTGQRFGRLVAVERFITPAVSKYVTSYRCECDCGEKKIVAHSNLNCGRTTSCGCYIREVTAARNIANATHGETLKKDSVYRIWNGMRQRCNNPNNDHYDGYGGRGINICKRWDDYVTFRDDMGPRPVGHTIDRKDNNGNYEPGNCRWATGKVQGNNRRTNRPIEFRGVTKNIKQWATERGLSVQALRYRIKAGWSLEKAMMTPADSHQRKDAEGVS